MWEVEDKPVTVLTALDYTFPLFQIIQEVYSGTAAVLSLVLMNIF